MKFIMSRMDRASPEPEKGQDLHETALSDLLTSASACSHSRHTFFSWQQVSQRETWQDSLLLMKLIYQAVHQKQVACYIFKAFFISRQNGKCFLLKQTPVVRSHCMAFGLAQDSEAAPPCSPPQVIAAVSLLGTTCATPSSSPCLPDSTLITLGFDTGLWHMNES